ncbi:putative beta-glucan synthesis-associated protein C23H3.11c [Hypsizygus marmoreus]|uniref:Beta-glucan synthesis-associated protein C23H3.11c n=1 Tax=Hypsizygus marmoreus TaxID=39966 RepID=A0A369J3L8_HYPMA|nr:putative beta-glucan synthesis-associated protein C23H3.11c [Hypsizygus marmoreus]
MATVAQDDYADPPSPIPRSGPSVEEARLLPSQSDPNALSSQSSPLQHASSSSGSGHSNSVSSRPSRAVSTATSFVSSPLNPTSGSPPPHVTNPFATARSRPASRASHLELASAHHRDPAYPALANAPPSSFPSSPTGTGLGMAGNRGSMVLYRLASDDDHGTSGIPPSSNSRDSHLLPPPKFPGGTNRDSTISSSGSSFISFDSKYPTSNRDSAFPTAPRGLVPYAYDPGLDELDPVDEEDMLHDPAAKGRRPNQFPWRGIMNVTVLVSLILALLCLFVFYPVLTFYRNEAKNSRIDGNIRINSTGQAPVLFQMPDLIDTETPDSARSRTGYDGFDYELVFSDEFNTAGRSFYPGDDPYWEAVDLWYGATGDLEWYDPQQITTRDGHLVITMDSVTTLQAGLTPGSTAPFTAAENHGLNYRSGMLQSWNKFCFSSGYIEVAVVLPGPNEDTQGYWPGAWTMGNLARPGYSATTDGMWPYTYSSCDVGTFANQTDKDKLGPAAALHSDFSREKYNYELSWLSGQRLSSCSCPGSDHPGPDVSKGRGAPEIDIFEAERDKDNPNGHVFSQSAQFAPFTHDYIYLNATQDEWVIYEPDMTRPNTYKGSAVQQAVSGIVKVPSDVFQGTGQRFLPVGFEYWANPSNQQEGFITWQVDGTKSHRLGSAAMAPDQGAGGSGVGQRLIPEEPMSIVLNLGISPNWQKIDPSTMIFPAEMLIDYVRVYQRKGHTNVGCNPKDYPTEDYINAHEDAYQNVNTTTWNWVKPKNSLFDGC